MEIAFRFLIYAIFPLKIYKNNSNSNNDDNNEIASP